MNQIDRIEVDKLFGLYDHRIKLHPEEGITLLHGPNGVGKTVLLRLLNGLLNRNYEPFVSVPCGQTSKPQSGQVYFVLLAAFFVRVFYSPSPARS